MNHIHGELHGHQYAAVDLAEAIYDAGVHDLYEVGDMVSIGLAESQGYDHAWNWNYQLLEETEASTEFVIIADDWSSLGVVHVVVDPAQGKVREKGTASVGVMPLDTKCGLQKDVGPWQLGVWPGQISTQVETNLYVLANSAAGAVSKLKSQGKGAWAAYNSTVYLRDSYLGRSTRGCGNAIARHQLAKDAVADGGIAYVHKFKHPVLEMQFRFDTATKAIADARATLGWGAGWGPVAKAAAIDVQHLLATAQTAVKAYRPS